MYFITTLHNIDEYGAEDCRCFGYYRRLDIALEAVSENRMNMHEYYYHYLVIEEIKQGIHPDSKEIAWFKWDNGWKETKKPKEIEGIVNWALG